MNYCLLENFRKLNNISPRLCWRICKTNFLLLKILYLVMISIWFKLRTHIFTIRGGQILCVCQTVAIESSLLLSHFLLKFYDSESQLQLQMCGGTELDKTSYNFLPEDFCSYNPLIRKWCKFHLCTMLPIFENIWYHKHLISQLFIRILYER